MTLRFSASQRGGSLPKMPYYCSKDVATVGKSAFYRLSDSLSA